MSTELITRRSVLAMLGSSAGLAACGGDSSSPPANAIPSNATAPDAAGEASQPQADRAATAPKVFAVASEESRMVGRAGTLIRIEGLIVHQIFATKTADNTYDVSAVDLLLVDSSVNKEPPLHPHMATIGIPRDVLPSHTKGAIAVDRTHAYWSLDERTVSIGPTDTVPSRLMNLDIRTIGTEELPEAEAWRSMSWLADLKDLYPDHNFVRTNYRSILRLEKGVEFEPEKIEYGLADLPNGSWWLTREADGKQKPGRPFKHSAHGFIGGSVTIKGLVDDTLIVPVSNLARPYAIRIQHVPVRAGSKAELIRMKDARAYADLLEPSIAPKSRWHPEEKPTFRTSGCGCCPMTRVVDLSGKVPSL